MSDTTYLYRFFDPAGQLLYVGISHRIENRFGTHKHQKPWDQVASIKIERFPTRLEAAQAERKAIATEKPAWNVIFAEPPPWPTCSHCQRAFAREEWFFGWEGKYYCHACWVRLDMPPPIERPRP